MSLLPLLFCCFIHYCFAVVVDAAVVVVVAVEAAVASFINHAQMLLLSFVVLRASL